jgi:hypothetical protein
MFQVRGYAVMSLALRDLASKSVLSLSTLAACREVVFCVSRIKPLLIRGVRFLLCDRRLWCSAPWVVKMQVCPTCHPSSLYHKLASTPVPCMRVCFALLIRVKSWHIRAPTWAVAGVVARDDHGQSPAVPSLLGSQRAGAA